MKNLPFIIGALIIVFSPCNTLGDSAGIYSYSYKIVDKYVITSKRLPGTYGENVIYNGWVYYAPIFKFNGIYINEQQLPKFKNFRNIKLGRLHMHTGKIQVLDLSKVMRKFPSNTQIVPYDGSYDGKCVFLSPYKAFVEGREVLDKRALKICR